MGMTIAQAFPEGSLEEDWADDDPEEVLISTLAAIDAASHSREHAIVNHGCGGHTFNDTE